MYGEGLCGPVFICGVLGMRFMSSYTCSIDTPPGTSDEHLTVVSALRAANLTGALIVATPQLLALDTVRKELTFCRKMGVDVLGLVENLSGFVCPCCEVPLDLYVSL